MLDMIIRGGQVVAPEGASDLDVGIQDGRIAVVAAPGTLGGEAGRMIDATGMIVLPGGESPSPNYGPGGLRLSPNRPKPPAGPLPLVVLPR